MTFTTETRVYRGRYIFLRVPYYRVNPIKSPANEPGPHTTARLVVSFPDYKAHRETSPRSRRLIPTSNNKRDPKRSRSWKNRYERRVWPALAKQTAAAGIPTFNCPRPRAVHFAEADPLIGRAASSSSLRPTNIHWCHRFLQTRSAM